MGDQMSVKKYGRCSCGEIEYSYEGDPINIVFCYCKECQIHTGSDKFFAFWVPKKNFKLEKGDPAIFIRQGDSGKPVHHHFCRNCGVTAYIDVLAVDLVSIAAVTLDNSDSLVPKMAIYTTSAPKWAIFPENIHLFEKLPPGLG